MDACTAACHTILATHEIHVGGLPTGDVGVPCRLHLSPAACRTRLFRALVGAGAPAATGYGPHADRSKTRKEYGPNRKVASEAFVASAQSESSGLPPTEK